MTDTSVIDAAPQESPAMEAVPAPDTVETLPEGFEAENRLPDGFEFEPEPEAPAGFEFEKPEEPSFGQKIMGRFLGTDVEDPLEIPRLGAIVTGGVAGGIAGSRVPTFPGPAGLVVNPVTGAIAGGLAGTVTGALAPETALEIGETVGLLEEGTRDKFGLSPEELRTVVEGEALLDVATAGGLTALRLAGRAGTKIFTGSDRASREAAEAAARQEIDLLPVQVGGRTIGRGFVAVMGRFPLLGGPIRARGAAAEEAFRTAITSAPSRVGPVSTASDVSTRIFQDAKNLVKGVSDAFDAKYSALWQQADEAGVWATPSGAVAKGEEILAKIGSETPTTAAAALGRGGDEAPSAGKAVDRVRDFINTEILPLREAVPGANVYAKQTLRQMDGMISKIDQEIAALEPSQARFARSLLLQLRQSIQKDELENLRGVNADGISRAMRELDTEFSHTMSELFETSVAKRFGSVERRGLRGVGTDKTTRMPVDQLARSVVNLNSPQAIEELSRLVTPETFQRIAAHVIDDALLASRKATGPDATQFSVETFARRLGLDNPGGDRFKVVEKMLEQAGGTLRMSDMQDLVVAGRAISSTEIPNVSSFIARRATIGGLQGIINGVVPGLAIAGGSTWAGGPLIGMATLIGGSRLISSMLANPESARAVRNVLDKEATRQVRRQSTIRALRFGVAAMSEAGEIDARTAELMDLMISRTIDTMDSQIESMLGGEQ